MNLEETNTSSEPLNNPDAISEEGRILESIYKLRAEFDRIVSTTGPSKRSHCIRNEIERLEGQFASCKDQLRERIAQKSQDKR